ncbi:UNVERIFIED_CONTAM: hypothetical protein Sradi_1552300 [Sesamum radiatum]|uniref:Uncharacterized protein n=1 Tax=Sesamum radiatum TaxID=300843 RepID=A0AAW2UCH0_SESRA
MRTSFTTAVFVDTWVMKRKNVLRRTKEHNSMWRNRRKTKQNKRYRRFPRWGSNPENCVSIPQPTLDVNFYDDPIACELISKHVAEASDTRDKDLYLFEKPEKMNSVFDDDCNQIEQFGIEKDISFGGVPCGADGDTNDGGEFAEDDENKKIDDEEVHENEERVRCDNQFDVLINMGEDPVTDVVEEQQVQNIIFKDAHFQEKHKRNASFDDNDAVTSRFNNRGISLNKRHNSTCRRMQTRSALRSRSIPPRQDDDSD